MKFSRRSFKNIKTRVVFALIFTLLFPYSLLAQASPTYKVPKNSLSYFLQNPSQKEYLETTTTDAGAVIPPLTPIVNQVEPEKIPVANYEVAAAVDEKTPEIYQSQDSINSNEETEHFEFSWKSDVPTAPKNESTEIVVADSRVQELPLQTKMGKDIVIEEEMVIENPLSKSAQRNLKIEKPEPLQVRNSNQVTFQASKISTQKTYHKTDNKLFSVALAKMEKRKGQREIEAQKLGIVLPSQSGDVSSVSPSLAKIQKTLKDITARHHCPSNGDCKFCA